MKNRFSRRSQTSGEIPVQHGLGNSPILYAADMAKPMQAALPEQAIHAWHPRLSQDIFVWDVILPSDIQDLPAAAHEESVDSALLP